MQHNLDHTLALLERTPAAFDALLRGLPEEWTRTNEGEKTWSAWDIVAHLIYCDRANWMARARRILDCGEEKPLDAFDRAGHVRISEGKSMNELLDEFASERREKLEELRGLNLQSEDFARCGAHSALGAVALGEVLATWAAHDLNHLHQLSRVMAYQYREATGPLGRFLGVMKCGAHGE